ncbi:hypothetical protein HAZT_HAZT006636 [Hyalella azteca]|uniref:SMB domain-containing protein n=1 Tax=Hyalella azteca TaxID=294128 RepID=A0A6A0GYU2_HYAAZ|nr:hypothetical protein HAZT_HAZT006636 [Hyalella azteca]
MLDINSATHTTAFLHRLLYDVKQKPQDVPAWKLEQESPFGRTWNLVTGEKHDLQDGRQWQLEDSEGSSISTLDVRWRDVRSAAPEEALPKTISSSLFCPLNSCEARSPATTSESVACKCDPLCSYYGDCCEDSKFRDRGALRHPDAEDRETELGLPPPPDTWLCLESTGATLPYEGVYAVDSCPAESYLEDAMRCELNVAPEQYSPVMDIPVASASAHNLCNPAQVNNSCDVEVIRIKLPKHAPSHISFYCLAITYSINNVTILLNNRLYVNETNEEYRYGEYEVADDGYSHRLFIKYSLYAWIMPLIFASTAIAVDLLTPRHYYLRPEFGTLHCWFNNKNVLPAHVQDLSGAGAEDTVL